MKRKVVPWAVLAFLLLACAVATAGASGVGAQAGTEPAPAQVTYDLSWHVVAGGGGQSQGGNLILGGTAGQPAAGPAQGDGYDLCAGFWCGPGALQFKVYLPLLLRGM